MPELLETLREDYNQAVTNQWIKSQKHPYLDLWIHNYTNKAQTTKAAWQNPAVRVCRGLITGPNNETVARPFPKFFNHDQPEAPTIGRTDRVSVYDKLDGSLGILYPRLDSWSIATRGSFNSNQAVHANGVWRRRYAGNFAPRQGYTFLFEIVYPSNRIVVNYYDLDDLVLLGVVDNGTGQVYGPEFAPDWHGPSARVFTYPTLLDALKAPPRDNREGFVIHSHATGDMVKLKYADYVRHHKAVSGLSSQTVWSYLSTEGSIAKLLELLPDEVHAWVTNCAATLDGMHRERVGLAERRYGAILARLAVFGGWPAYTGDYPVDRKAFAELVQGYPKDLHKLLFGLLDGKDISAMVWKDVKPSADIRPYWGSEVS